MFNWRVLVWCGLGVVWLGALSAPTVRLPSDTLGIRRFQTPELTSKMTVGQSFVMTADGFHAIEFQVAPGAGPASGDIHLALVDITGHGAETIRTADVAASELLAASTYRFEFDPIEHSKNVPYRLELSSSEPQGSGIALWATKGDRYERGSLEINEIPRWADLAFQTSAPAGRAKWESLLRMPADRSSPLPRGALVLGILVGYWAVLGVVLLRWPLQRRAVERAASPEEERLTAGAA